MGRAKGKEQVLRSTEFKLPPSLFLLPTPTLLSVTTILKVSMLLAYCGHCPGEMGGGGGVATASEKKGAAPVTGVCSGLREEKWMMPLNTFTPPTCTGPASLAAHQQNNPVSSQPARPDWVLAS